MNRLESAPQTGSKRAVRSIAQACALLLILGACSAVPEWADPSGWFAADGVAKAAPSASGDTVKSDSFPNLASVPNDPPTPMAPATRAEIRRTLAADRAKAEIGGQQQSGAPGADAESAKMPGSGGDLLLPTRMDATQSAPAGASPSPQEPSSVEVAQVAPGAESVRPSPAGQSALRLPQFDSRAAADAPAAGGRSELVAVIYFGYGSTALSAVDREILRNVAKLQRQRGGTVRVIGHASARTEIADAVRHRLANFETSLQRANAVAAQLARFGVARGMVAAEAKADTQPVYHEFMPTGEAGNRRAEIFLEN